MAPERVALLELSDTMAPLADASDTAADATLTGAAAEPAQSLGAPTPAALRLPRCLDARLFTDAICRWHRHVAFAVALAATALLTVHLARFRTPHGDLNRHPSDRDELTLHPDALVPDQISTFPGLHYPTAFVELLRDVTECTNLDEVLASVGFADTGSSPYPPYGHDVTIDRAESCYVVFEDEASRQANASSWRPGQPKIPYRLENGQQQEMAARNDTRLGLGTIYRTHARPCGACSTLQALAAYLLTPDLTNPVRSCGMKLLPRRAKRCLQEEVGLPGACGLIWYYNTVNTKKLRSQGGCFGTCISRVWTPNNEPDGKVNPCAPAVCANTINGAPACSDFQWQNGPYRLNACIQCDECRSGPIFQKVAGRTRRASGISSAIKRPPGEVSDVYHVYGFPLKWA